MTRWLNLVVCLLSIAPAAMSQAVPSTTHPANAQLRYVVVLTRHGVRSPTGKATQYLPYSKAAWPAWPVAPGYLTPHGFRLMELFGAYDRMQLSDQKLFAATGCDDASRLTIYADSDQRTRETGKAIAQGLFPGCAIPVQSLPEGKEDSLFHPVAELWNHLDPELARAAVAGRIGGNPTNITAAYQSQIASLDKILANCGETTPGQQTRTSLFDIPATLSVGTGDHLVDLKGPINTASTLSENLLLEYTEGMSDAHVGWGCVHRTELESLMELHSAATDYAQRTPEIARAQASNLLDHINRSIQQAVREKPVAGAIGHPSDRALFLVGHDTNLENVAGLLNLNWIIDGRRDDTPPGSALVFEVWQEQPAGKYVVRTYFTAQTLDQMRTSTPLNAANHPQRVPIYIPGCSRQDLACPLDTFSSTIQSAINPQDVLER
jgi:4-phytase/acid phosphatase